MFPHLFLSSILEDVQNEKNMVLSAPNKNKYSDDYELFLRLKSLKFSAITGHSLTSTSLLMLM